MSTATTDVVVVEKLLDAPASTVWSALTDKDKMKQWYFTLDDFKAEVGFVFRFTGKGSKGESYLHTCKILDVVPNERLSHTWTYDGVEGHSIVTFELKDEGGKTKLTVTHTGLDSFPKGNPDFAPASFNGGWTALITVNLPKYLANA